MILNLVLQTVLNIMLLKQIVLEKIKFSVSIENIFLRSNIQKIFAKL